MKRSGNEAAKSALFTPSSHAENNWVREEVSRPARRWDNTTSAPAWLRSTGSLSDLNDDPDYDDRRNQGGNHW